MFWISGSVRQRHGGSNGIAGARRTEAEQISVSSVLETIARRYPPHEVSGQLRDIPRIAFNIDLALASTSHSIGDIEICDLGGGIGLFSVGCAALGVKKSVLIDDFRDPQIVTKGEGVLDLHRSYGVEIYSRDILTSGISDIAGNFDVITCFDSMEHWHSSPKSLFMQVLQKLKPNGSFVLGVPNCVNLRKRLTVPFGYGKWSPFDVWYEETCFRGHVREPDVDDLEHIASDMRLHDVKIIGRNWQGYFSANAVVRAATSLIDRPLRLVPSLCADLYLTGRKSS